jgi:hypothetical protein
MVKDEAFRPVAGAEVELNQQPKPSLPVRASTDEHGAFRFSGLRPGEYSVLAGANGFINYQVTNIRIKENEDLRLFRILLDTGEVAGNCVVRVFPKGVIRPTSAQDVEIAGRVVVRHGQTAQVTLDVFTDSEQVSDSVDSDNHGRFRFVVHAAGDVRLEIEILNSAGEVFIPTQHAEMWRTKLDDRLTIPKIKLNENGLGHFCD